MRKIVSGGHRYVAAQGPVDHLAVQGNGVHLLGVLVQCGFDELLGHTILASEQNRVTDKVDNIIIEHLRNLRSDVASMRSEMHAEFKDVKARLSHLDASMAGVRRDGALSAEDFARQQVCIDSLVERIPKNRKTPGIGELKKKAPRGLFQWRLLPPTEN